MDLPPLAIIIDFITKYHMASKINECPIVYNRSEQRIDWKWTAASFFFFFLVPLQFLKSAKNTFLLTRFEVFFFVP